MTIIHNSRWQLVTAILFLLTFTGCKTVSVPVVAPTYLESVDVGGLVNEPKAVTIPPDGLRLWPALIRSGGVKEVGDKDSLVVSLHRSYRHYHFALSLVEGKSAGLIQLLPGDIVSVDVSEEVAGVPGTAASVRSKQDSPYSLLEWEEQEHNLSSSKEEALTKVRALVQPQPQAVECEQEPKPAELKQLCKESRPLMNSSGEPLTVSVILRTSAGSSSDVDIFVFPTLSHACDLKLDEGFKTTLDTFMVYPGSDLIAATNLGRLPIIASSQMMPHINAALKAAQQGQIRLAELQKQQTRIFGANLPLIGPVFSSLGAAHHRWKTKTVVPYPVSAPAALPASSAASSYATVNQAISAIP